MTQTAVERHGKNRVYHLAPGLDIQAPTTKAARKVAEAKGTEAQLAILLGGQYQEVMDCLEDQTPDAQLAILTELTEWLFEQMGIKSGKKFVDRLAELEVEAENFADAVNESKLSDSD